MEDEPVSCMFSQLVTLILVQKGAGRQGCSPNGWLPNDYPPSFMSTASSPCLYPQMACPTRSSLCVVRT